jgi:hypothetical protein
LAPSPRKPTIRSLIKAFLIANPHATNAMVMAAVDCSTAMVTNGRNELRVAGMLVRPHADHTSPLDVPPTSPVPVVDDIVITPMRGTAEVLEILDIESATHEGGQMTPDEQRKFLTLLSRDTTEAPQVRMAAMAMYNKLVESTTEPLTRADIIMRLSLLMRSQGPSIVLKAYEEAFNVKAEDLHAEAMDARSPAAQAEVTALAEGYTSTVHLINGHNSANTMGTGEEASGTTN